jgi:hypothetical protein
MRWLARALLVIPCVALGQRVTGRVTSDAPRAPVSGAVVILSDSAGKSLTRGLTDRNGRYSLALPASAAQVRAIRIGFRPASAPIPARAGDVTIDLAMERAPAMLAPVRVAADASCRSSDDGRLVLQAWEQARSALLAAIVAREANPAQVELLMYQRRMKPDTRLITEQRMSLDAGRSTRPMAAARPAEALAADGYVKREGADQVFYAPDADVLFDESFAEAHCFGIVSGRGDRLGQIGLTFAPRGNRKRDFADVEGTLWIDPQQTELRQLDYRYTGLDPDVARAGAGGTMHFASMTNGVVFIDSWSILIPVVSEAERRGVGGRSVMTTVVSELSESGGYVAHAAWPDGTRWSNAIGAVRGHVREEKTGLSIADASLALAGTEMARTDSAGRYALPPIPPGRYELAVTDSAFAGYTKPRVTSREIIVARGDTVTSDFELRSRESLLSELCRSSGRGNTLTILGHLDDGSGPVPRGARLETSWVSMPVAGAAKGASDIRQEAQAADVTASGAFIVCGVPFQSSWITMSLRMGRVTIADTMIPSSSYAIARNRTGTRSVEWKLPAGTFAAALRGDASVLSGRVTGGGAPIANVQVWIVLADTMVVTDSAGRFRIAGLSAGQHIVQLRRLGYDVKRDSVTLRRQEETVRDFMLDAVPQLDTMRTIADQMKYNVPRLRDFENRRLSGNGGRFISEAELRKNEQRTVADVIRSYVPGLKVVDYRGQRLVSSTSAPAITLRPLPGNGPSGCWVSVYLDGIPMYDGEGAPPDMNQFFGSNLSGVEYYGSGANVPIQFKNIRNNCGTLLLWTRGR